MSDTVLRAVLLTRDEVAVWELGRADADALRRVLPNLARGGGSDATLWLLAQRCEATPMSAADAALVTTVLEALAGVPTARAARSALAPEPEVLGPETVLA